jgi:hypothetical protein
VWRFFLSIREEHRLRVFENWVLRRIFAPKQEKVTRMSKDIHDEELHNFYSQLMSYWC